ncbi:hypothetical protein [Niveispirillum sp.]|nr:hypothetical protein [Niveispirillum sp.]MBP7337404.1 hypothetical protein [Niveispirillum sp.]
MEGVLLLLPPLDMVDRRRGGVAKPTDVGSGDWGTGNIDHHSIFPVDGIK